MSDKAARAPQLPAQTTADDHTQPRFRVPMILTDAAVIIDALQFAWVPRKTSLPKYTSVSFVHRESAFVSRSASDQTLSQAVSESLFLTIAVDPVKRGGPIRFKVEPSKHTTGCRLYQRTYTHRRPRISVRERANARDTEAHATRSQPEMSITTSATEARGGVPNVAGNAERGGQVSRIRIRNRRSAILLSHCESLSHACMHRA